MRPFAHRHELLFIFLLLLLACSAYLWQLQRPAAANLAAEIYLDRQVLRILPLHPDDDYELVLPECPGVRLAVRGGRIAFIHSDCPDQICVHSGWLGQDGAFAACLPNGLLIKLRPLASEAEQDLIIGAVNPEGSQP